MEHPLFDSGEMDRLSATLARFLPHTERSAIALTGGVAIELHCRNAGRTSGRRRIADVDFVTASVDVIDPSVAAELLVSHFHLPHDGYPKFMMQLVDPYTRLRIDVFPDLAGSLASAAEHAVAGHRLLVLDADSILDHKLQGVARASAERPIDEKHAHDAAILGAVCGRNVAPPSPERLTKEIYRMNLAPCPRCDVSRTPGFGVAPRDHIFEILGYN